MHIDLTCHSLSNFERGLSCHKGHAHLASQDVCALSRHYVPVIVLVRCNLLEPGKELTGVLTVPPTACVGTL